MAIELAASARLTTSSFWVRSVLSWSAWDLRERLLVVLRRECMDFVIESFGPGRRPRQYRSDTVLGRHLIERADHGAAEQITGVRRLRPIMGHHAAEQDELHRNLRQVVA